jgi:hypothetical protein
MGISDSDINEQPADDGLPGNVGSDADGADGTGDGADRSDADSTDVTDGDGTDTSDADSDGTDSADTDGTDSADTDGTDADSDGADS